MPAFHVLFNEDPDKAVAPEVLMPSAAEPDAQSKIKSFYVADAHPTLTWPRLRRIWFEQIEDQKWDPVLDAITPGDLSGARKVKVASMVWTDIPGVKVFYGASDGLEPMWALFDKHEDPLIKRNLNLTDAIRVLENQKAEFVIESVQIANVPIYDSKFVGEGKFNPMMESGQIEVIDDTLVKVSLKLELPFRAKVSISDEFKFSAPDKKFKEAFDLMIPLFALKSD